MATEREFTSHSATVSPISVERESSSLEASMPNQSGVHTTTGARGYQPDGLPASTSTQRASQPAMDGTNHGTHATTIQDSQLQLPPQDAWTMSANPRDTVLYDTNARRPPFDTTPYMPDYPEYPYGSPGVWQHKSEPVYPGTPEPHPREDLPSWKWKALLVANNFMALINGYDVSNVANIQAPVYNAFGRIELLPWVGLSYSVVNIAMIPLARKLFKFYDFKVLNMVSLVFLIAGSALAGAAPNLNCVIAGRALMAIGASVMYQGTLSFNIMFAYPHELALVQASLGASFAIGLITGPIIGGAFADSEHATWRWAFYFALPLCGIVLVLLMICLPDYRVPTHKSMSTHFKEIDWIGSLLHMGTFLLFGAACIFSGGTWAWDSGSSIAIWTVLGLVAVAYVVQQYFSIGTTPEQRIFPCRLLTNRTVVLTWICTCCIAVSYGVTLYYTPIYFAFTHGHGPLAAAVRLLPFICVFIFMIFLSGGLLPALRVYMPFFVFGAVCLLVGAGLIHTIGTGTSESTVMGFEALLGAGIGFIWQLAIPVCSVVLQNREDRLDQAALHNMAQLGGTAISLSIAGAVYQNVGLGFLKAAVGDMGFSDEDIRELLSGAGSPILATADPKVLPLVVGAVTEVIVRCFYLVIAAGSICFIAACFLRVEALDFKKAKAELIEGDAVRQMELHVKK